MEGLIGAFIIYDTSNSAGYLLGRDYDEDRIVILHDWYHNSTAALSQWFLSPANPDGNEPLPDSALINGMGQYDCTVARSQGYTCSTTNLRAVYSFVQGTRYRLRVINASGLHGFRFSIDAHNMTVIEVEGTETQPTVVDALSVNLAERFSVIVTASRPLTGVNNYWMRGTMLVTCFVENSNTNPNVFGGYTYYIASVSFLWLPKL